MARLDQTLKPAGPSSPVFCSPQSPGGLYGEGARSGQETGWRPCLKAGPRRGFPFQLRVLRLGEISHL